MTTLTSQSRRMFEYVQQHPNQDIPAPELNAIAAGDGQYVSSFSRRTFEVREYARSIGADFIKSVDKWHGKQRRTCYRYIPPTKLEPEPPPQFRALQPAWEIER